MAAGSTAASDRSMCVSPSWELSCWAKGWACALMRYDAAIVIALEFAGLLLVYPGHAEARHAHDHRTGGAVPCH